MATTDDTSRLILICTNRHTGVRWYQRVPPNWRPPAYVQTERLFGPDLDAAWSSYVLAQDPDTPLDQVHELWRTPPDHTCPPPDPARPTPHAVALELDAITKHMQALLDVARSWPEHADPWAASTWVGGLSSAQVGMQRLTNEAMRWTSAWPPDHPGVHVQADGLGLQLGDHVQVAEHLGPLCSLLPGSLRVVALLEGGVIYVVPEGAPASSPTMLEISSVKRL